MTTKERLKELKVNQSWHVPMSMKEALRYARRCLSQTGLWWEINTINTNELRIRRVK